MSEKGQHYRGLGITSPCKDCENRHEACHMDCKRHKSYRDLVDTARMRRMEERRRTEAAIESMRRRSRKSYEH